MRRISQYLAIIVLFLGVVGLAMGIVFIVQGATTSETIKEGLRAEKVTLGLPEAGEEGYIEGNVVDTTAELQAAQDILLEHMRDRYETYGDTERGSPERTSYLDGLTLMNSMYIAAMGLGVSTVIIVSGVFMIITGLALGASGVVLLRLTREIS